MPLFSRDKRRVSYLHLHHFSLASRAGFSSVPELRCSLMKYAGKSAFSRNIPHAEERVFLEGSKRSFQALGFPVRADARIIIAAKVRQRHSVPRKSRLPATDVRQLLNVRHAVRRLPRPALTSGKLQFRRPAKFILKIMFEIFVTLLLVSVTLPWPCDPASGDHTAAIVIDSIVVIGISVPDKASVPCRSRP